MKVEVETDDSICQWRFEWKEKEGHDHQRKKNGRKDSDE